MARYAVLFCRRAFGLLSESARCADGSKASAPSPAGRVAESAAKTSETSSASEPSSGPAKNEMLHGLAEAGGGAGDHRPANGLHRAMRLHGAGKSKRRTGTAAHIHQAVGGRTRLARRAARCWQPGQAVWQAARGQVRARRARPAGDGLPRDDARRGRLAADAGRTAGGDGRQPTATASDFVSANVAVLARELQPTIPGHRSGGKRIGVTAVLGEKFEEQLRGDELVHEPPLEGLKKAARRVGEAAVRSSGPAGSCAAR